MRDARRAAVWIVALVISVLAGDRVGDTLLNAILLRSQFRFSRVYRGNENASIVVIGDSRGVNSFYAPAVERLTGERTLNLSYNSMSSRVAEVVLADYLDHNRPPRLVVVEVTDTISPMALVPELRTYANISPRLRALYAEQHPIAASTGRVFHLLAYNSEFFIRAVYYFRRSDQDWIMRSTIGPELLSAPAEARQPNIPPENLEALARTVRLLRQRGVTVRLVIAPYLMPRITKLNELIDGIERSSGLPVLNYIAAGGPPANFADRVHMNERGAELFMQRLAADGVWR